MLPSALVAGATGACGREYSNNDEGDNCAQYDYYEHLIVS
jgi:hypothetical protein